jgi:hypothetical protein
MLHAAFGGGFLDKVYENALTHDLCLSEFICG